MVETWQRAQPALEAERLQALRQLSERQGARLNLDLVREEVSPLIAAKNEPELAEELEKRIKRHIGNLS